MGFLHGQGLKVMQRGEIEFILLYCLLESSEKNRGGSWKAAAAFQLPDPLRIFIDSSVWGREEETGK